MYIANIFKIAPLLAGNILHIHCPFNSTRKCVIFNRKRISIFRSFLFKFTPKKVSYSIRRRIHFQFWCSHPSHSHSSSFSGGKNKEKKIKIKLRVDVEVTFIWGCVLEAYLFLLLLSKLMLRHYLNWPLQKN